MLQKMREIEENKNREKAREVKDEEEMRSSRMKEFNQSRIKFSKETHNNRVIATLKQKEKTARMLQRLKKEQEQLEKAAKDVQSTFQTSVTEINTLNPEKGKKKAKKVKK